MVIKIQMVACVMSGPFSGNLLMMLFYNIQHLMGKIMSQSFKVSQIARHL